MRVNLTARVETLSTETLISCLNVSTAVKIVMAKPKSHFTLFEIIDIKPLRFTDGDTDDVMDRPRNILSRGTIIFDESCDTPSPAPIITA